MFRLCPDPVLYWLPLVGLTPSVAEHLNEAFIPKDDIVEQIFSGQAVLGKGEAQRLIFI